MHISPALRRPSPSRPSPPSPVSEEPAKAMLATYAIDHDFRRAALDIVQRLTSRERASRKRRSRQAEPAEVPSLGARGTKVELHVLHVQGRGPKDEQCEEKRILRTFRENGVRIVVHHVDLPTSFRLSLTPTNPLAPVFERILQETCSEPLLGVQLEAAGFAFGTHPIENNDVCRAFLSALAAKLSPQATTSRSPPTVTLYIPSRPTSSDFDLDLPDDQVLSLRILHTAAETMKRAAPPPPAPSPPLHPHRHSLHLISHNALPTPTSRQARRRSHSPHPPSASSSLKPLVLRPAPGPIQSVSMRFSLDPSAAAAARAPELAVRVSESLTPVDACGQRFDFPFNPSPPSPSSSRNLAPTPPPSPPRAKLRLAIPAAESSRRENVVRLPPPLTPVTPWDRAAHSPIEKVVVVARHGSGCSTTSTELAHDPQWREVRELLKQRVERAQRRIVA
ncbi:hypothetical protein JCM5296_002294 [Sporobolomyces johnsonii]